MRRVLHETKFLRLVELEGWVFAERSNAVGVVVVVALTDDGRMLFTEQWRKPVGAAVIELPAGLVGDEPGEDDESHAGAARRELLEETGYRARRMEALVEGPATAGLSSEILSIFLARGLERVDAGGGVEGENIKVHSIKLSAAPAWLRAQARKGKLVDPKVYAGLWFAERKWRPKT